MNSNYRYTWCHKWFLLTKYTNREFEYFPVEVLRFILFHGHAIPISYSSFYCAYPGKYILTKDIYFDNNFGAAITVMASNTDINLNGFGVYLMCVTGDNFNGTYHNKYCIKIDPKVKSVTISNGSLNGDRLCGKHIGFNISDDDYDTINDREYVRINNIECEGLATILEY